MSRAAVIAAFCTFAVAHVLSNLVRSANAVLATDLSADLGLGPADLGAMSSVYFLVFAAAQLPLGVALDRFGPRVVTSGLMVVAAAGAGIFASATTFEAATVGRAAIGLGTAAILMGALKAMSTWTDPKRFAAWSGTLVAIGSTGSLLSAGPLAAWNVAFGWRSAFAATAAALLLTALAVALLGRARPVREDQGERAAAAGVDDRASLGSIVRSGWFLCIAAMAVTSTGMIFAVQGLWAGPYLEMGLGMDALEAGRVLTAFASGVTLGTVALGWISLRAGLVRTTLIASAAFTALQVVLASQPEPGAGAVSATFLALGSTGAVSTLLFALVRTHFPARVTGRAITAVNLFMFAGGFLYQRGIGVWLERGWGDHASTFALTAAASTIAWGAMALHVARHRGERTTTRLS